MSTTPIEDLRMFHSPQPQNEDTERVTMFEHVSDNGAALSPTTPTELESPIRRKPRKEYEPSNPFLTPQTALTQKARRIKRLLASPKLERRFTPQVQRRCLYALIADTYDDDTSPLDMIEDASEFLNDVTQSPMNSSNPMAPSTPFRNVKVERAAEVKRFVDTLVKVRGKSPTVSSAKRKKKAGGTRRSKKSPRKRRRVISSEESSTEESDTDEDDLTEDMDVMRSSGSESDTSDDEDSESSGMFEDSTPTI